MATNFTSPLAEYVSQNAELYSLLLRSHTSTRRFLCNNTVVLAAAPNVTATTPAPPEEAQPGDETALLSWRALHAAFSLVHFVRALNTPDHESQLAEGPLDDLLQDCSKASHALQAALESVNAVHFAKQEQLASVAESGEEEAQWEEWRQSKLELEREEMNCNPFLWSGCVVCPICAHICTNKYIWFTETDISTDGAGI